MYHPPTFRLTWSMILSCHSLIHLSPVTPLAYRRNEKSQPITLLSLKFKFNLCLLMFFLGATILWALLCSRHFKVPNFYSNSCNVRDTLILQLLFQCLLSEDLAKPGLYWPCYTTWQLKHFSLGVAHHRPGCSQAGYLTGLKRPFILLFLVSGFLPPSWTPHMRCPFLVAHPNLSRFNTHPPCY